MIRYFAAHPTAGNIVMMAIIALGLASLGSLNRESFPQLKPSKVQVTVIYPGAAPADVEAGICNPLEDATDGISFLKEQDCDARDNVAIFTLEMQESGEIREFTDDIITAIDGIQNFPENIESPVIRQLGRINAVANIAITADKLSPSELKALAEYYRDRLLAMPAIPIVTLAGFSKHQLQVLIHPDTQQKYSLGVQDIAALISAQAVELPAGTLEATETSFQIRFDNVRKTADQLADLVIINTAERGQIKLGDIARIEGRFEKPEERIELNGKPAALLQVSKNLIDDTLNVADALYKFVEDENRILPEGTELTLVNDGTTAVRDRLQLLLKNGWQGLMLATLVLLLFFTWRYSFWIALGLPISFLGGMTLMVVFGVSINMISMVALLMAIGILMDDAIVLSESIHHEYDKGKTPLDAAIDGTKRVLRGVFASYLTSAFLFGSLIMMKGDMGQVLGVLPVVLLSVLTISLIEAFLVLPHHLKKSLEHAHHKTPPRWRQQFELRFDRLRQKVVRLSGLAMKFRYLTVGVSLGMLVLSVGLLATGIVKFKAFPDLEGNTLEARILLPQGTPLSETERIIDVLLSSLERTDETLSEKESEPLVQNIQVTFGQHGDVPETGSHVATIAVDLISTETRNTGIMELTALWQENTEDLPDVVGIQYKEARLGPAGRAIHIRLNGENLHELSQASWQVQNWLRGYAGVYNLLDDVRPGKPQFKINLMPGALAAGVDSQSIARQLRAAYHEVKIDEIYQGREDFEIIARLDDETSSELRDFDNFIVFSKTGREIPLGSVAVITEVRDFARIGHINHRRTVNIYGDVDADIANTSEIIASLQKNFLSKLQDRFPDVSFSLEGEVENGNETKSSILTGFALGAFGVFLLLSLQFRNYREPIIVMINIPLALIGAIWGHLIMGLDFTLPSMIGFVSLAGVVVNDSILLVEYVKNHIEEGMDLRDAAQQAVNDRFRAIFLTSVTTIAGMTPLLFESSTQALILVPMVASIVFGMVTSTMLIMLVLPAMYTIMNDIGFVTLAADRDQLTSAKTDTAKIST
jgi:HAE1 family hydrophobic/amphiphilic exporter-1